MKFVACGVFSNLAFPPLEDTAISVCFRGGPVSMTEGQGELTPRYCPRCGGLMRKPAGSPLYWHADNNHPRCDITNLVDPLTGVQATDEPPPPPQRGKRPKNSK